MYAVKKLALAAALVISECGSSAAFADDCNRVAFKFTNQWREGTTPVDIRVKKVAVVRYNDSWNENIKNKLIQENRTYTTKQRRLQHLDDGQTADFTVHFEHRKIGAGWMQATHGPFTVRCMDGIPIAFTIMSN